MTPRSEMLGIHDIAKLTHLTQATYFPALAVVHGKSPEGYLIIQIQKGISDLRSECSHSQVIKIEIRDKVCEVCHHCACMVIL